MMEPKLHTVGRTESLQIYVILVKVALVKRMVTNQKQPSLTKWTAALKLANLAIEKEGALKSMIR